jgi:hypothetical protein
MSNCNKLFLDYNKEITPSQDQLGRMRASREALEKKIFDEIQEQLQMSVSFLIQGSNAPDMKTIIIKEDGTYDVDRGVYLPQKPDVSATTVQKYVLDAVEDHTADGAEHRKKCIRVLYQADYNIDFPCYYEVAGESYCYLAVKNDGWIRDDPFKMIEWFGNFKDEDGQLVRMVKYLKGWASKCACKMPSGIALTIWAAKHFKRYENRDDKCLFKILMDIQTEILFSVSCYAPVEPFDDVTAKLSIDQKNRFREELDNFCAAAKKAIEEDNQLKSSKMWRKYLGDRFPEGVDEDLDKKETLLMASASLVLNKTAKLSPSGQINSNSGVSHQDHRNYGG